MNKKRLLRYLIFSVSVLVLSSCRTGVKEKADIVPLPADLVQGSGYFTFTSNTTVAVEDEEQATVAAYLAGLFTNSAGFTPHVKVGTAKGDLRFLKDTALQSGAYDLHVSTDGIEVKASDNKGFFYAVQTLRLALPAAIDNPSVTDADWSVPAMSVTDRPRFEYRGLMLDVARYFMPSTEVMRIIDCMAMLKLNTLHLHLSDDTGWRLEIKRYPRLTEIGAWRVDRGDLPFYERRNALPGETASVGGFYTQEEMRKIISYAAERQIEIIPEIDMPAHSNAALAAYPELACPVVKVPVTVLPGLGGRNTEIIYCAGNDKVFEFLQGVVDEVTELFPSQYIHLGGDEAVKTYWEKCPLCRQRMKTEHLDDAEDLQGYFMGRVAEYVRGKGKKVMGWDELTNSTIPEDAVIFGWRGFGNAALKAVEAGHRFVMTPARVMYLIRYQGPQWFEPLTYFGNITLKDVYDYEPVQEGWKPEYESRLMGVQASMWTEFCNRPEDVTYQIFPRLAALAETAWSPKGRKDWNSFLKRLDKYLAHLDAKGVVYAESMYNVQHKVVPQKGQLIVKLECIRPDVEIRYTLDGSEPGPDSPLYRDSLSVDTARTLMCAAFSGHERKGKVLRLPLIRNKATGKPVLGGNANGRLLTNGVRGSLRQSDFEWCTWDKLDRASFTIDLLDVEDISKVSVGCLTNYGMAVHKPRSLAVELSEDNLHFVKAGEMVFTPDEIFREGNFIEDVSFEIGNKKARYIRITAIGAGKCPPSHFMRPGQDARYYLDEVMVE